MKFIADSASNPFGMTPPCERSVPGYGATDADFHVVGDHPGVHGGLATGVPFTDRPWSGEFFDALVRADLLREVDLSADRIAGDRTFFSYLHMCAVEDGAPTAADYDRLEPFFDAELRAITAHVLLPVGPRATEHVLRTFTSRPVTAVDMEALHATTVQGTGWLIVPIADPAEWGPDGADRLVEHLLALQETDYRQQSDLGRFTSTNDQYLVR